MRVRPTTKPPQESAESYSPAQVKRLVEVISRSQHNFRSLVDHLDQAVFTISLDGVVRVANLRLAEILGAKFAGLIGHNLSEFVEVPTLAQAERALPEFRATGSWGGVLPVRLKQGRELRYFNCWLQVAADAEEPSITGWARDITAERESEVRFAELFDSLSEGIFFASPEGRILDANPALVRMLGYAGKGELQALNFRDVHDDPVQRDALAREMEERGSVRNRELALRRKDGQKVRCLVSGFAIRDPLGRVVRHQGMLVDVTQQRAVEKQLHHEQEFIRRLIACFPDVIAVLDREGRFTFASPRVNEALGLAAGDLTGQPFAAHAAPEDQPVVAEKLRGILAGSTASVLAESFEYAARHADGSSRILRVNAAPLFDPAGRLAGVVASLRDVTDQKVNEQELAQKEKFAAMGQMMAGAAHELNNPLTAILGASDLLRERVSDDTARRQLGLILQEARRAAAIVQDLLALARPRSKGRAKIHLAEVVQQALQLQQPALSRNNIAVKFEAPAQLPAVTGDRNQLLQIFANIINNAEQAISGARGQGALHVALSLAGESVCVAISDDGPGIPSQNIPKIFDPFFTTKRPGGGSGLGLAICLAVVKEHGGTIEVESKPDAGATFRVLLPVAGEKALEAPAPAREAQPTADPLRGHTVLVVDDEESIREIVYESLSARGMIVRCAANSAEALSELREKSFDAVLCDFNLPGMKGEQLFEQLRAERPEALPRFVFITGDLLDSGAGVRLAAHGARVLQKPFQVTGLAALLAEVLQPQPTHVN